MNEETQIVIYESSDGEAKIEVQLQEETVWRSQRQMGEIFKKDTDTIGLHLKNIFESGELQEKATTEYFSVVQTEGKRHVKRKKLTIITNAAIICFIRALFAPLPLIPQTEP